MVNRRCGGFVGIDEERELVDMGWLWVEVVYFSKSLVNNDILEVSEGNSEREDERGKRVKGWMDVE